MHAWFADALARLGSEPVLQAILAALGTFILEDPTTVGCGLLVADGRMGFATAWIGVTSGIAVGDVGLYAIGRWAGPVVVRRGWVSGARIERASGWLRRNLVSTVLLSRFIPGMRLPTYVGAGMLHAPPYRFVGIAVGASVVWTLLVLWVTVTMGQAILPLLGRARWPAAVFAILLLILLQLRTARRVERRRSEAKGIER